MPIAAADAAVVLAAHHGPSATPLIIELAAAALIVTLAVTRRPLARLARAATTHLAQRRADRRVARPARVGGR